MHYLFSGTHATENTGTDRPKYAIVGQEIYSTITNQKNTNIFIENSGIYLVKVKTESNFYVSKIIVNK